MRGGLVQTHKTLNSIPSVREKEKKKKTGREDELYGVAQQKHKKGQLTSCFRSGKLKSNRPA